MKAIVYTSKAGHTERYARMLSKSTGLPAYSLAEARSVLPKGEEIFYMGWVMAGTISGIRQAAKWYQVRGVAACGAYAPDPEATRQMRVNCGVAEDVGLFYLQGGIDYKKLHGLNRWMLLYMSKMMGEKLEAKPQRTAAEEEMLRTLKEGGDFVLAKNLNEIEGWMRARQANEL